jgi:hypothetical protein
VSQAGQRNCQPRGETGLACPRVRPSTATWSLPALSAAVRPAPLGAAPTASNEVGADRDCHQVHRDSNPATMTRAYESTSQNGAVPTRKRDDGMGVLLMLLKRLHPGYGHDPVNRQPDVCVATRAASRDRFLLRRSSRSLLTSILPEIRALPSILYCQEPPTTFCEHRFVLLDP